MALIEPVEHSFEHLKQNLETDPDALCPHVSVIAEHDAHACVICPDEGAMCWRCARAHIDGVHTVAGATVCVVCVPELELKAAEGTYHVPAPEPPAVAPNPLTIMVHRRTVPVHLVLPLCEYHHAGIQAERDVRREERFRQDSTMN